MWIRALSVKHFAGIRSADLAFVKGLNVLHGPNELGKSTLVTAIRAAFLLQDSSSAAEALADWHTDQPPQVTLTFEVEPQRIWRIRKRFGQGTEGSSYLDFSRDGKDFTQDAKGREVDGKLRETLRWGLDAPGGKGKKRGFGESFLSTTLLARQDAVTAVLTRGLDDDPDDSGKRRLIEALQALAEDPAFRQILVATQQKVDEAYTSTGQRSRRRDSPWIDLRAQRQAAEKHRAELGARASVSAGARRHVQELRDTLNEAQSDLDEKKRLRGRLDTAWQQRQAHEAIQADITAAMAEQDRIQTLHHQLGDVRTALQAAEEAVKSAKSGLQKSTTEQKAAAVALHAASERLLGLESSETEQSRTIQRQELDKRLLANENRQRAVELRRTAAVTVRDLDAATKTLRAAVDEKSSTLAEAEALVAMAISRNQGDNDEIAGIEQALLAAQILAARRDRERVRDSAREAAELEALAAARHEEAQKIRAELAHLGLPDRQEIESLAKLETDLRVAEGKLQVGISVDIRPARPVAARIQMDDAPVHEAVLSEPTLLDASSQVQLTLGGIAVLDIRGGRPDARQDATDLRQRWHARTAQLFTRLGVTDLADIRQTQRDGGERLEQTEALERDARSAAGRAKAAAATDAAVEALDTKVGRLEQRMASLLSSKRGLEKVLRRHSSAGDVDDAALEDRLKSLREACEIRKTQVGALEQQLAKDHGILETKKQALVSREEELHGATEALGEPCATVLEQTGKELDTLASERQRLQHELASLGRNLTVEVEQARAGVATASSEVEGAELKVAQLTTRLEEARGSLERLRGEVSTRQELVDRENLPAALAALGRLQARLAALPTPEANVTDADRTEADGLVQAATDQRDGLHSALQKAEGALQQVGGHAIQEKLEQADEAVQAIDRREHEVDLDYGAWQLLRDTLREAEADNAVHLGKALIEPITTRMADLTNGRYGDLAIGPQLKTAGIHLAGTSRDITSLSVGTQEQLATVLRLTIADAIGSTVVLDDQLVQSDAARMAWLRTFMLECATRFQILVFTCRPEDYALAATGQHPAFKSISLAEHLQRSLSD